jgi:hypothetical protein
MSPETLASPPLLDSKRSRNRRAATGSGRELQARCGATARTGAMNESVCDAFADAEPEVLPQAAAIEA